MILNWQRHLKFPPSPRVSPEAINILQSLLCEPESRIGTRPGGSVIRTNSVLAKHRMSAYGLGSVDRSIDGADLIKVRQRLQRRGEWGKYLMQVLYFDRPIRGSRVSIGTTSIVSRRHSVPISRTLLTLVISTMTFPPRYAGLYRQPSLDTDAPSLS